MCLCSESQGSAIHELSPHTWPVSKAGQSVSPPKQGCVDPPPPPVSTAGPPGFPLPACVQGKATWVPTPYLCPRRGHLSPTPRLCPRQGHLGSRFPPVSKAGPPGFPLPACVQGRATRVPAPRLCPRQGHMPPPLVLRKRRWGQGPPAPLLPASPTDWALPGQAPGAQGCPCCRVQSPAALRAPLGAVETWSCFRVHSVEK